MSDNYLVQRAQDLIKNRRAQGQVGTRSSQCLESSFQAPCSFVQPNSAPSDSEMSATIVSASTPVVARKHISLLADDSALGSLEPLSPLQLPRASAFQGPKRTHNEELKKTPSTVAQIKKNDRLPNFGNDYSTTFVKYGVLPQTWVRNIESPLHGYPKLELLHAIKARHNLSYAPAPVGVSTGKSTVWGISAEIPQQIAALAKMKCQFDVVMLQGCVGEWSPETFDELCLEAIMPRPSLLFFWVPPQRIEEGRSLMDKWGFRRGEDITYCVNSLESLHCPPADESMFVPSTWHCLMGIKGTIRRTSDTDVINCNVDTDVIIEKKHERANIVPEEIYNIIENFTSMRRRLHIVCSKTPETLPVRLRPGWVIMGPSVFNCGTFDPTYFQRRTLVPVHPDVDGLRPQTPPMR